jgi:signal peptidase I
MENLFRALGGFFLDIIETVVIALSIFLIVYLFIASPHQVNGQSMVPTFQSGEYVLSDKVSYRVGQPQRGDVIVFHAPAAADCPEGTGCDFIKRVLGLPGESVQVHDNHIYVNGQPLEEPYIPAEYETNPGPATKNKTVSLGPDEFFVSGDNRPYSSDSRAWGPIHKSDIVGKAFFRYWPLAVAGKVKHESYPF